MPLILVLLFIIVPLLEIIVIIQVGQAIGAWWTVGLLVADSMLGAWLLRREGARAWQAFREALAEGRWPGDEVAQGSMVIVGGTLLLTPGFLTDVVGFLLLVPVSRRIASRTVRRRVRLGEDATSSRSSRAGGRGTRDRRGPAASGAGRRSSGEPGILDVEVVEIRRDDDRDDDRDDGGAIDDGDDGPSDDGHADR